MAPMQPPSARQGPSLPSIAPSGVAFPSHPLQKLQSISDATRAPKAEPVVEAGQPSHAFDMLLQASLDEAETGVESAKDQQLDDSPADSKDEDDDKDFYVDDSDVAEDDDDEEYFDSHMERKKRSSSSRRGRARRASPSRPSPPTATAMTQTGPSGGALELVTRLAGPQFLETLDPVQVHFLSVLPPSAYRTRTTTDELLAMKCNNRECAQVRGNAKKPNSIYCSSKCQSREQNLRQGRVKNVRRLSSSPVLTIAKPSPKKRSAARPIKQRPMAPPHSTGLPSSVFNASASLSSHLSMNMQPPQMAHLQRFDPRTGVPQHMGPISFAPRMAPHPQVSMPSRAMPNPHMLPVQAPPRPSDRSAFSSQPGLFGVMPSVRPVKHEAGDGQRSQQQPQHKLAISYLLSAGDKECRNLEMLQLPPPVSTLQPRGL